MLKTKGKIVTRDIINCAALWSAIAAALEGLPPALQIYHPALKTYFHRSSDQHDSIRKARRRKADPGWAHQKFDNGQTLYRFDESRREDLFETIRDQFCNLVKMAVLAQDRAQPMAREAGAFLGGLSHQRDGDLEGPGRGARNFLQYAQLAALKARRHQTLREPAERLAGTLTASRCISLDAIIRLGRSAQNCLSESSDHWEDFVSGKIDVWSLCDDVRLVAVLSINQATHQVIEAKGPRNRSIAPRYIHDVARFCREGNLGISKDCEGLLAEYAERPVLGPKIVVLGDCVAEYTEWSDAVRIDVGNEGGDISALTFAEPSAILSLAFDPAVSCATEIIEVRDPRHAISTFGKKRLRKIIKTIAMNETTPTLVQHRLLALTA